MAAKRYLARIYRPKHRKQKRRYKGKLIGCTETVGAMFADAVTVGGCQQTEDSMRAMSNEPVPNDASPGLNLGQMAQVMSKLGIAYVNRTGAGDKWPQVKAKLDEGRRVQLSIWIGVNHSILLQAVRARPGGVAGNEVLMDDPLDGSAKWVTDDTIIAQAQAFITHNGGDGFWYAYSAVIPPIAAGAKP